MDSFFTNPFLPLVGSIICGVICEKFGYLKVLHCISTTWIIGNIVTIFLISPWILIGSKIAKGFAIGFTFTSIPIYGYETIPYNKRGAVLSLTLFACTLGNFTSFVLFVIFDYLATSLSWMRIFWFFEIVPAMAAMILTFYIPESPKWLATNSEWTSAANVLQSIQATNSSNEEKKMKSERLKLGDKHFVIKEYSSGVSIKSCKFNRLFGKKYIKEMATGILVQLFLVMTFITKLSQSFEVVCNSCLFFEKSDIRMASFFLLSMRVLFAALPILVSDAVRRKDAIFFSMLIMTCIMITYFVMFTFFSKTNYNNSDSVEWVIPLVFYEEKASLIIALTVAGDVLYRAILLPISWLLIVETFSSSSRVQGWVVSTSIFWVLETVTSIAFPFLLQVLQQWLFLIIVVIGITGVIFATKLTETKGKFRIDADYIMLGPKWDCQPAESKLNEDSTDKLKQVEKGSAQTSVLTAAEVHVAKVENIYGVPKIHAFHSMQDPSMRKAHTISWDKVPKDSMQR